MGPGFEEDGPEHERPDQAEGGGGADSHQTGCGDEGKAATVVTSGGVQAAGLGEEEIRTSTPDRARET